ncbi:DUF4397 domain-containing protein [Sanguibacter suarezii]|uniref:DUF4397 domain-containing protein n=1 Tax=Sanguibacter suarezii TaxID=60921 RepID=UPI000837216E
MNARPQARRTMFGALALTAATTLAGLTMIPAAQAAEGDAQLSVLHAVPGLTVDVWVNGERTLDDFTPGSLAGPLELPAGTYSVAITAADAADASSPAIGPVDLSLTGNTNYTAVAHLDASGAPTATLFTNDTSTTPAGDGRLTVRHVAAAPAVDVLAGGTPVITNLANPDEKVLDLPAGTLSVSVAATGTTTPVIGPADVPVTEGVNTIVYAWGSLADGNLALATQTIDGLHASPAGVPAGEVGLADTGSGNGPAMGVAAAASAGVLALGAVLYRRRSGAHADR